MPELFTAAPEFTYLGLSLAFTVPMLLVWAVWMRGRGGFMKSFALSGVALLAVTLVFNNLIIGTGLVAYDEALISGVRLGLIPVEDFAYAVVAALFVPLVYLSLARKRDV